MMISNLNLANLPECVCEMRYIDSALLDPCAEYQRVLRTKKSGGVFLAYLRRSMFDQ